VSTKPELSPLDDADLFGLLAEFNTPHGLRAATKRVREAGYRRVEAYTPFPVEGLADDLGFHRTRLPLIVLCGAIVGGVGGFGMETIASVFHYPLNIGGRPLFSWPAFLPVTFELAVLGAALGAVLGMLSLNGLPRPYHPVFNIENFALASSDRFFLCVIADDPQFDRKAAHALLAELDANAVVEVPK